MNREKAMALLKSSGALLEGHFLLTSGNHSDSYIQCALLLSRPELAFEFMWDIAEHFNGAGVDAVIAPAVGGIIVSYEVGRLMGKRALFCERDRERMTLRRGFSLSAGEQVLVVEDVITTGGSVLEVAETVEESGAEVVGFGSIVNRSSGRFDPGKPYHACVDMDVPIYPADECPLCAAGGSPVKPGSRGMIT
jgi:orotate phosphoribosyltransferase